jgi:UDPglucose 6-dehydrogenase
MMNSYLAAKVTFMNEFYKLAEVEGVDWNELCALSTYDTRMGRTHMSVPGPDGSYGWGGACFPKDMAAIINEAKSLGVDFKLLEQIQDINKEHRNNG